MTLHRITILTSCLTLTMLGTACDLGDKSIGNDTGADQGETGDPGDGDGDTEGNEAGYGGDCGEEIETVINDLDAALAGFDSVAADYIALVEGTFVGEFSWLPEDGPVTVEHAGTTSPLTMTVTYEGGEIRLIETELVGQPPQGDGGLEEGDVCSNILLIDFKVDFVTEDGLFAESFEIPITFLSHSELSTPSYYFTLDMDAIQGELALDDFVVDQGEVSALVLTGQFDGDVANGSLNIEILTMDWVGFGSIAGFDATRQP
jgi:hypothetical protein